MPGLSKRRRGLDERRRATEPGVCHRIDPTDPKSVAAGFEEFRHFLRMMEGLGELLALLPGCDVLEEQK